MGCRICKKGIYCKELCKHHYYVEAAKNPKKRCSLNGCDRALKAKGLCSKHYELNLLYGRTDRVRLKPQSPICTLCTKKHYAKDLCKNHYMIKLRNENPLEKLIHNLRVRTQKFLKYKGFRKISKTRTILGCTKTFLMEHLESQFQPGMTWENYGEWHIDHIYPLGRCKSEEEILTRCHYSNLQPLWRAENLRKGSRVC